MAIPKPPLLHICIISNDNFIVSGTNLQIHKVNLSTGEISDPVNLRGYFKKTVKELKALISEVRR